MGRAFGTDRGEEQSYRFFSVKKYELKRALGGTRRR
jgi:hypothetical protein